MTSYQQQFVPGETLETLREYEERMEELVKQAEENTPEEDVPTEDTPVEEESGSEETTEV